MRVTSNLILMFFFHLKVLNITPAMFTNTHHPTFFQVEQADISPTEIVFSIKEPPRIGHVVKLTNDTESTVSPVLDYVQSFTQEDINMGTILYVSASLQGQDMFTLDVSNGFTTIEDLEVQVDIMPRLIPVQVANLTVREGDAVTFTEDILNITHPFYRSFHIEFLIEEAPQHGEIRYLHRGDDGLVTFSWDDVSTLNLLVLCSAVWISPFCSGFIPLIRPHKSKKN